ncbi:hypothetical protein GCM10022198_12430 [Klugiella xanthotipulae]
MSRPLTRTLAVILAALLVGGATDLSLAPQAQAHAATTPVAATLPAVSSPAVANDLSPAAPATGGVIINEVVAAAWNNSAKDQDGEAKDWVELYNPTDNAVDISYWGLSNKDASAFRWTFPAGTVIKSKAYLVVWLSKKDRAVAGAELHASFNLDNGVDPLLLSVPDGSSTGALADSVSPPRTKTDQSWCRMPSGSASSPFNFCETLTKGAANSGKSFAEMAAQPVISPNGGVFSAPQIVTITAPSGSEIRYTTNGSEPVANSTLYTAPFSVSTGSSVRAASFRTGAMSSITTTASFVIDAQADSKYGGQRVIMVTLDPADDMLYRVANQSHLFDSTVDLRETDGSIILQSDAESKVAGQLGSLGAQKIYPLNVTLRDARGETDFTYPLFPGKGTQTIERFRLRNSGNDFFYGRLRDSFAQSLMSDSASLWSGYTPVAMFVNGEYRGLMDIREREDETLVESSTGADKDSVQYVSDGAEVSGGAEAEKAYSDMVAYMNSNSMTNQANYEKAQSMIDTQALAEVTASYAWAAVWDWPWKNIHAWRSTALDNKWQYKSHDFDIGMDVTPLLAWGANTKSSVNMYGRIYASNNYAFSSLMRNPEYQNQYINTVADQMNSRFKTENTNARLDEMVALVKPYIAEFRKKNPALGTAESWETTDVARLREFLNTRNAILDTQTQAKYKLSARQNVTVGVNNPSMGTIMLNSLALDTEFTAATPTWTGSYYPEVPITVKAQPLPGYRFAGWSGGSTSTDATITVSVTKATALTATFAPAGTPAAPVFAPVGAQKNLTGDTVDVTVGATDPAGFALSYSAKQLPKGVAIDASTGHITGKITTPGSYTTKVTATNGVSKTTVTVAWTVADRPNTGTASVPLSGRVTTEYWKNATLSGDPALTNISPIGFALGTGTAAAGLPSDNFSVRWSTTVTPTQTGTHTLHLDTAAYDGVRVYVNDMLVLDKWASTTAKGSYDVPLALTAGARAVLRVEYVDTAYDAALALTWKTPGSSSLTPIPAAVMTTGPAPVEATGEELIVAPITSSYWKNRTLTGAAAQTNRYESSIGMDLAAGAAPAAGFPADNFGASWETTVTPQKTGEYSFQAAISSYDGARIYVNNELVVDAWNTLPAASAKEGSVTLTAGQPAAVRVEYYDSAYDATFVMRVKGPGALGYAELPEPTRDGTVTPIAPVLGPITAAYWKNRTLTGDPAQTNRFEPGIGVSLASGAVPLPGFPGDNFGIRWTSTLVPQTTGDYVLRAANSLGDGVRVYADDKLVLDNWSGGVSSNDVSLSLTAGKSVALRVEFFDGGGDAQLKLSVVTPGSTTFEDLPAPATLDAVQPVAPVVGPITAEYWKNRTLTGAPTLSRGYEQQIGLKLASGVAPAVGFPADNFGIRWSTTVVPQVTGNYTLRVGTSAYDGVRVYLGDRLVLDNWTTQSTVRSTDVSVDLTAGEAVPLRVDYFDSSGDAALSLGLVVPGAAVFGSLPVPVMLDGTVAAGLAQGEATAEYWKNRTFAGSAALSQKAPISLDLGSGVGPASGFPTSSFAIRWNTEITAEQTGTYTFRVANTLSDGVRVYADNALVLNNWTGAATDSEFSLELTAAQAQNLRVEFCDAGGTAQLSLLVRTPGSAAFVPLTAG